MLLLFLVYILIIYIGCNNTAPAEPMDGIECVDDSVKIADPKLEKSTEKAKEKDKTAQEVEDSIKNAQLQLSPFKGKSCEQLLAGVETFYKLNLSKILAGKMKKELDSQINKNIPLQDCLEKNADMRKKFDEIEEKYLGED